MTKAVGPGPGLRERKKARTREAIQHHALRLFREQGFEATTVEQIAEAAEISPSTFFRYFPTKEEVLLYDAFDPFFIEAFRNVPSGPTVVQATRIAWRDAVAAGGLDLPEQRQRAKLIIENDGLRARMLDEFARSQEVMAGLVAERTARHADDPLVRATVGAMMGIAVASWLGSAGSVDAFVASFDEGLAFLEAGLPL